MAWLIGFLGGHEKQPAGFRSRCFPLRGYAAGDDAASVTEEQIEENVNHEVHAENAERQKDCE